MSKHIILKTIFTSVLGLVTGYGITYLVNNESLPDSRRLASIPYGKVNIEQFSHDYFQIKMINKSLSEVPEENSTIVAEVIALKDISTPLNYKWILGREVDTQQAVEGVIDPMQAGESKYFELSVKNYSKFSQSHVNFSVTGFLAQHQVKREAIISSRPEDSFEYVVQQAELQNSKAAPGQVKKLSSGKSVSEKFKPNKIIK